MPPRLRFPAVLAAIALVLVARGPDAVTRPQFWAEDATVFFLAAWNDPARGSLFTPYAGYLHLLPRLVARAAVACLSPEFVPACFNVMAIAVAAACLALFSAARFRFLIRSDRVRVALCLLAAWGHPATEIVNTLTNVHWYLTLAAALLVTIPARSRGEALGFGLVQLVAGLSCPLAACVVPLAVVLAVKPPQRNRVGAWALAAAVGVQVAVVALAIPAEQRRSLCFDPQRIAFHALDRGRAILLYGLVGYGAADWLDEEWRGASWLVAGLALLAWAALVKSAARRRVAVQAATAFLLALTCLAAHGVAQPPTQAAPGDLFFDAPAPWYTRFLFVPYCLWLFALGQSWEAVRAARRLAMRAAVRVALLAICAGQVLFSLRVTPLEDLDWPGEVRRARAAGWIADVPVNPRPWMLQWRGPRGSGGGLDSARTTPSGGTFR